MAFRRKDSNFGCVVLGDSKPWPALLGAMVFCNSSYSSGRGRMAK